MQLNSCFVVQRWSSIGLVNSSKNSFSWDLSLECTNLEHINLMSGPEPSVPWLCWSRVYCALLNWLFAFLLLELERWTVWIHAEHHYGVCWETYIPLQGNFLNFTERVNKNCSKFYFILYILQFRTAGNNYFAFSMKSHCIDLHL